MNWSWICYLFISNERSEVHFISGKRPEDKKDWMNGQIKPVLEHGPRSLTCMQMKRLKIWTYERKRKPARDKKEIHVKWTIFKQFIDK